MNSIERAVYDMRDLFNETDIHALTQRIKDLEYRVQNLENELAATRQRHWQQNIY